MTHTSELKAGEYNEYYKQYIDQVPGSLGIAQALETGMEDTRDFFTSLSEDELLLRYEEGKWTPKEVLLHLIDTERIFSYRALRFSRMDSTPLQGFEQDDFVLSSDANSRTIDSLIAEYVAVRQCSLLLYASMTAQTIANIGTASGSPMSPRAAAFITAGHERHHIRIIKERYL
ncbi:DinB family protein [Dokdonia sp. PRO95]|uniref:DinB family protein n=1 Tax=Dokdonia sp. PRO95 TaxID=1239415 RepID=UPI00055972FF|nr:DinB family protein [Dokdonia sp. PRO95]